MSIDHHLTFLELLEFFFKFNIVNIALFKPILKLFLPLNHLAWADLHILNLFFQDIIFMSSLFKGFLLFNQSFLISFKFKVIFLNIFKSFVHWYAINLSFFLNLSALTFFLLQSFLHIWIYFLQVFMLPSQFKLISSWFLQKLDCFEIMLRVICFFVFMLIFGYLFQQLLVDSIFFFKLPFQLSDLSFWILYY